MGVTGLLPCLQSISYQVSLEKYRGLTVGVDAMCWLHKAVYASDPIALAKTQFHCYDINETNEHVARHLRFDANVNRDSKDISLRSDANRLCAEYVLRQVEVLTKQYQMNVILVLDGAPLPIKQNVNRKRTDNRHRMFNEGIQAERRGDQTAARKLFAQSCSVSYDIKLELIHLCRQLGIAFIVAPYEADAQIAKLAHTSFVDIVITEDSDLLLYGCPRVLFKADFRTGTGVEIQILRDLGNNDQPSFQNWTHDMFIYMCILSGCDYCEGISGLGLQTAHKLVRIHRTPQKLFKALARDGRLSENFEQLFWAAFKTFRHQRVYCSQKDELDFLFPLEQIDLNVDDWEFLGPWMEPETSRAVASGILHPESKIPWTFSSESNHTLKRSNKRDRMDKVESRCTTGDVHFSFFSKKREMQSAMMEDIQQKEDLGKENNPAYELQNCMVYNHGSNQRARIDEGFYRGMIRPRVPIHFEDYTSALIGSSFETLSRSQRRNNPGKRYDILQALERLRCKQASQIPQKPKYQPQKRDGPHNQPKSTSRVLVANNSVENTRTSIQDQFYVSDTRPHPNPSYSHVPVNQISSRQHSEFSFSNQFLIDDYHDQQFLMELLREDGHYSAESLSSKANKDKAGIPNETFDIFGNHQQLPMHNQMYADDWTHCFHSVHDEKSIPDDEFTFASSYIDSDAMTFNNQSYADREIIDMNFISDLKRLADL